MRAMRSFPISRSYARWSRTIPPRASRAPNAPAATAMALRHIIAPMTKRIGTSSTRPASPRKIAEQLYKRAHRGDFEEIVIVAPPQLLGEIRRKLHKEVTDRVRAEIPKTLTNQPVWDIARMLREG